MTTALTDTKKSGRARERLHRLMIPMCSSDIEPFLPDRGLVFAVWRKVFLFLTAARAYT